MAVTVLNDRVELASIYVDVAAIGTESISYSDAFYSANSSLSFKIPKEYDGRVVLTDLTNKVYVEGVNQQTKERYIVEYSDDENTEYGSDWVEGYYKIHVRQYMKPTNGTDILSNVQNCKFFEMTTIPLYWNRSQISFMTYIQPGKFWMGSPVGEYGRYPDREVQHHVTISRGYYIMRTQVSNKFTYYILL